MTNYETETNYEKEIQEKGYFVYTVKGISMMPLLRQRKDIMVIRKITEPLKKDDTVVFKRVDGAYVLHRIVKILGDGQYSIVGDNCSNTTAEIVPEERIIGILTEVIKDGRHILVESDEYKAYVKKVPMHRLKLTIKQYCHMLKSKIKNGIRRIIK